MRSAPPRRPWPALLAVAAVLAGTAAVYRGVGGYGFVFDDFGLIHENPPVARGLGAAGLRWALLSSHGANWHPVTWLLHMANVSLFGLDAGAHHLVCLAWHSLAGVLVFLALRSLTGALWAPAFVAGLFALHPLHVEAVAWIAEIKDPASAVFWLLAVIAWGRHARRPSPGRYAAVAALMALGLMTKQTLVALPAVLLLLDWWPLGRLGPAARGGRTAGRLLLEKAPLLALAVAGSAAAYLAQRGGGAVASLSVYTPAGRAANALVSIAAYLGDTLWPAGLAVYYPHRLSGWAAWEVGGALALVVAATAAGFALRRRCPALLVGWVWFLLPLLPVIGLVQVGGQARADRYTYLPLIGCGIAAAWCAAPLARGRRRAAALAVAALVALAAYGSAASWQVGTWRNAETLWLRALAVTRGNWLAHLRYALALEDRGEVAAALPHFVEAARLNPSGADTHYNLARVLALLGRDVEAAGSYRITLSLHPRNGWARHGLGMLLEKAGRREEALEQFEAAARLLPGRPEVLTYLGITYANLGRLPEAEAALQQALRHDPAFLPARGTLERVRQALRR